MNFATLAKKQEASLMTKSSRHRNPFSAGALLEAIKETDESAQPTRNASEWLPVRLVHVCAGAIRLRWTLPVDYDKRNQEL